MRRILVVAVGISGLILTVCSQDNRPGLLDPGQPPVTTGLAPGLELGPIDGLTTVWHAAPDRFSVPMGRRVLLRCGASASDQVTWLGATEVERGHGWSVAECPTNRLEGHQVYVSVVPEPGSQKDRDRERQTSASGQDAVPSARTFRCEFDAIEVSPEVAVDQVFLSREPLHVNEGSSNWETMRQFSSGSIARLARVGESRYRTSVETPLMLECRVHPAALGPLMEWRVDGQPVALGALSEIPMNVAPGTHVIAVGPPKHEGRTTLTAYRVVSIASDAENADDVASGRPITYTATTDPPGMEANVTWLAATRFGSATPMLGRGRTFTVRFRDVNGTDADGNPGSWSGVRADNLALTSDTAAPPLSILYPDPLAIVTDGTWIVVGQPAGLAYNNVTGINYEYSSNGGATYSPILGVREDNGVYLALWNTKGLAAGSYLIRVTMVSVLGTSVTTRQVTVNPAPTALATAQSGGANIVNFSGSPSFDTNGSIASYAWHFSDGGTATGQNVQHTFASTGTYYGSLTVTDNSGGVDMGHYKIDLPSPFTVQFVPKAHCGCAGMGVIVAGAISGPAGFSFSPQVASGIVPAEQGTLGPYYDGGAGPQLSLATQPWDVKFRFMVVAGLTAGSDPSLCAEGQRVKRKSTIAGVNFVKHGNLSRGVGIKGPDYDSGKGPDNPYDDAEDPDTVDEGNCDYFDADPLQWCDDDYHGGGDADGSGGTASGNPPNKFKVYDDQSFIQWLDAPGLRALTAAQLPASYFAKFHASVVGDPSCEAAWTVTIVIDADRNVTMQLFSQ